MRKALLGQKGVALYLVIATLLIVIVLANVTLNIVQSHYRLTHHQISRIQAYYMCLAGINYAYEKLREGTDLNWPTTDTTYVRTMCRTCNPPAPDQIYEPNMPNPIKQVVITVGNLNTGPNNTRSISAQATYTFTQ